METIGVCRIRPHAFPHGAGQLHPEAVQSEQRLAVIAFTRQYQLGRTWPVLACVR